MKKLFVFVIIGLSLLLTGCGNKLKTYKEVDYKTLMNMFEEKQSFILFIGSTECQHCDLYKETLNEVISKYQVKISYIDISKLSMEENAKLKIYVNYNGTPTTAFIEQGEETSMYDRIDGNKPLNKVVEKLKKKGYIK
ncbi:MAG: hypothetical protein HFH09_03635 [Bacilli bacterium]|jgi:predicted bacteriocin transport accessory protein|nr:hypothetical protein [Bacilli bacterium]